MATKSPKELQPGDKVKLESGKVVTITRKGPGMYTGSTLLEWEGNGRDNWGHVFKGDTIEVL
jgi:hypothetical protein